jgi:hypothetical protein
MWRASLRGMLRDRARSDDSSAQSITKLAGMASQVAAEGSVTMRVKALKNADQRSVAVISKTRKQMIDKLAPTTCKVTGTKRRDVADRIIVQVSGALIRPKPKNREDAIIKGIGAMAEMGPESLTEAMLAAQMVAANDAALVFLASAMSENQTVAARDANVVRATRLMQVFTLQIEAMARLKGKTGQQKVIVEHVHVHQGGQAIVGALSAAKANQGEGGG